MRTLFLIPLIFMIMNHGFAKKNPEAGNPIMGTWKYTNQSATNDFHQISNTPAQIYASEYFIFEANNKFRHEFLNDQGAVVKVLTGKWKTSGEKLNIAYSDINYNVSMAYFFIDKDLVIGQNFNHVIFTKNNDPALYAELMK